MFCRYVQHVRGDLVLALCRGLVRLGASYDIGELQWQLHSRALERERFVCVLTVSCWSVRLDVGSFDGTLLRALSGRVRVCSWVPLRH